MERRTYFITRHVCDGGDVGCRSRRRARSNMSILRGLPTKRCAQSAPSLRVAARTVVCIVARLDHIDRLAPEFDSEASPACAVRLAYGPSWPQRITRLYMK